MSNVGQPSRHDFHSSRNLRERVDVACQRTEIVRLASHLHLVSRRLAMAHLPGTPFDTGIVRGVLMGRFNWLWVVCVMTLIACHPGPVLNTGANPPSVGGTIAGLVTT